MSLPSWGTETTTPRPAIQIQRHNCVRLRDNRALPCPALLGPGCCALRWPRYLSSGTSASVARTGGTHQSIGQSIVHSPVRSSAQRYILRKNILRPSRPLWPGAGLTASTTSGSGCTLLLHTTTTLPAATAAATPYCCHHFHHHRLDDHACSTTSPPPNPDARHLLPPDHHCARPSALWCSICRAEPATRSSTPPPPPPLPHHTKLHPVDSSPPNPPPQTRRAQQPHDALQLLDDDRPYS